MCQLVSSLLLSELQLSCLAPCYDTWDNETRSRIFRVTESYHVSLDLFPNSNRTQRAALRWAGLFNIGVVASGQNFVKLPSALQCCDRAKYGRRKFECPVQFQGSPAAHRESSGSDRADIFQHLPCYSKSSGQKHDQVPCARRARSR